MRNNFHYESVPDELKHLKNWILWKKETVGNRVTKVPYSALYRGKASSTNPKTWTSFSDAYEVFADHPEYDGLGFVFTKESGLIFIDIDDCMDSARQLDYRAKDILDAFRNNTFTELSQSGKGLHVFVKGVIPRSFKNPLNGVEMYDSKRYCAITGDVLPGTVSQISFDQSALDAVFERYRTPDRVKHEERSLSRQVIKLEDRKIIEKAKQHGELFSKLWSGEYSMYARQGESGHHIADLVLCSKLAFWTDRDPGRIDALFRCSGLYREKWERDDYRTNTISEACAGCNESLSEYILRKQREEDEKYLRFFKSR